MRFRKKIPAELKTPDAEAMRDRARKLSDEEIQDGLDLLLSNLIVYTKGYRSTRAYDLMCEIQTTASGIFALAETILERKESPLGIPTTQVKKTRQVNGF